MIASMTLKIRPETAADADQVFAVEAAANRPSEAELVQNLQQGGVDLISLVAELDGEIVGHILFSPVTVKNDEGEFTAVALGPVAVAPEHQNKGIGSELCWAGLAACEQVGYKLAFVLGHSTYYPRFGFSPSSPYGLRSQFDVPDDVFMVKELVPGALKDRRGTVFYHPLFSSA